MVKFTEGTSVRVLMTDERDAGRVRRGVPFVVAVEADDGSWCELDALDHAHAVTLAKNWVDKMNARGCSVWRVMAGGKLAGRSSFNVHADVAFPECDE